MGRGARERGRIGGRGGVAGRAVIVGGGLEGRMNQSENGEDVRCMVYLVCCVI